jgi:mono/diheme cytochrome c family protein
MAKARARPARGAKSAPRRGGRGRRTKSGGLLRRVALAAALVGLGAGGVAAAAWLGLVPGVQLRERPAPLPDGDPTGASPGDAPPAAVEADAPLAELPAPEVAADSGAPSPAPESATVSSEDSIAGETAYRGAGRCAGCHGIQGEGVAGLGPSLRDDRWLHGGERAAIRRVVAEGAAPPLGGYAVAMPAYGEQLGAARIAQLAAYVWTLSNPGAVAPTGPSSAPPLPPPASATTPARPTVPAALAPDAPVRRPTVPTP